MNWRRASSLLKSLRCAKGGVDSEISARSKTIFLRVGLMREEDTRVPHILQPLLLHCSGRILQQPRQD